MKEPSDKQLEARKKFAEAAKARAAANKAAKEEAPHELPENKEEQIAPEQGLDEMRKQMQEIMETNALLKAALLGKQPSGPSINNGQVVGEVEKYVVDPANYEDPTERLKKEPRLAPLAFEYNYLLEYMMMVSNYETKSGVNMREPRFHITLYRRVLDTQGNQVKITNPTTGKLEDKYYIARKMVFHEDPQAALVIARENGIEVDQENQQLFLNEMRYLRIRDWLFDIFWPRPADDRGMVNEEVIGGQVVQVYTRSSEDQAEIEFGKLSNKVQV